MKGWKNYIKSSGRNTDKVTTIQEGIVPNSDGEEGPHGGPKRKSRYKGFIQQVNPHQQEVDSLFTYVSDTLRQDYEAIKDALSKLKIPPDFRINDSKAGIQAVRVCRINKLFRSFVLFNFINVDSCLQLVMCVFPMEVCL